MHYSYEKNNIQAGTEDWVGSDRLRKAIERNRRKMMEKNSRPEVKVTPETHFRSERVSVAHPDDFEFIKKEDRLKRFEVPRERSLVKVESSKNDKYDFTTKNWWTKKLAKVAWIIYSIMVFRLIFAENGMVDYFSMEKVLQEKRDALSTVINGNKKIISEINRIDKDSVYQKKIARDYLGVVAKDEFLILFSK
ncbi:MAG: hypothetical protein U0T83_06175 [Bacteriovoracaceae bacterium]